MVFLIILVVILFIAVLISTKTKKYKRNKDLRKREKFGLNTEGDEYPVYIASEGNFKKRKVRESYEGEWEPRKGKGEEILFEEMRKYFDSGKIYLGGIRFYPGGIPRRTMDYVENTDKFEKERKEAYYPDIVYYSEDRSIAIDIEVDEPYIIEGGSKKPIHHIIYGRDSEGRPATADRKRNKEFSGNGWHVLRFSEGQAKNSPVECCRYLCNVLSFIMKVKHPCNHHKGLKNVSLVAPEKRWNREEAKNMKR